VKFKLEQEMCRQAKCSWVKFKLEQVMCRQVK